MVGFCTDVVLLVLVVDGVVWELILIRLILFLLRTILLMGATCPDRHGFLYPLAASWQRGSLLMGPPFEELHMTCSFLYGAMGFPSSSDIERQ